MKTKIKKIGYSVASAAILGAPVLALAQFAPPTTTETGLANTSITAIITGVMKWALALVGIIGVIAFVIAGIMYLTAAGDETRIEKAKKAMLMAIVGVIVALVGLIILTAVSKMLNKETGF